MSIRAKYNITLCYLFFSSHILRNIILKNLIVKQAKCLYKNTIIHLWHFFNFIFFFILLGIIVQQIMNLYLCSWLRLVFNKRFIYKTT